MRNKKLVYPLTYDEIAERRAGSLRIMQKRRRRGYAFLGLSLLEGSFLAEEPERIFATLEQGEKLQIVRGEGGTPLNPALHILREDGTDVGTLPFADSVLPNALIGRGAAVTCFAEAKKLDSGLLCIAVSLWCEDY